MGSGDGHEVRERIQSSSLPVKKVDIHAGATSKFFHEGRGGDGDWSARSPNDTFLGQIPHPVWFSRSLEGIGVKGARGDFDWVHS